MWWDFVGLFSYASQTLSSKVETTTTTSLVEKLFLTIVPTHVQVKWMYVHDNISFFLCAITVHSVQPNHIIAVVGVYIYVHLYDGA